MFDIINKGRRFIESRNVDSLSIKNKFKRNIGFKP